MVNLTQVNSGKPPIVKSKYLNAFDNESYTEKEIISMQQNVELKLTVNIDKVK